MSALALALDGSTYSSSAALLRDGKLIADARVEPAGDNGSGGRGEALVPAIATMLEKNGARASDVTTVICGAGPGSFTSLRIAASVAKGISVAAGAKMYSVPSLLLVFGSEGITLADGRYVSVLPAMRGEFFALPVSLANGVPAADAETHRILGEDALRDEAKSSGARVIGPGQETDAHPHARGAALLYDAIIERGPIDLHSWEPDYGRLAEAQVKWEAAHGRPLKA